MPQQDNGPRPTCEQPVDPRQDIVGALGQDGLTIDKHAIHLDDPIKVLGTYEIPVRLHPEVTATLKLSVIKA